MIENNEHIDPFFDAFKEAFDDYQPEFNAGDLKADWSGVKSQINPPQGTGINNPQTTEGLKSLLNLKNIIITSVTGVAIVTTTLLILLTPNETKNDSSKNDTVNQPILNPKIETPVISNNQNDIQNNTIKYYNAKQINKEDNSEVVSNSGAETTQNPSNHTYSPSAPISNNVLNDPSNPDLLKKENTASQNIPKIIITNVGLPKQDEIFLSDTQFCQNQLIRLSYNFKDPGYQKLFVNLEGKQLYDNNNNFTYKFSKPGWYNLSLTIYNYTTSISKSYRIHVVASPVASFNFNLTESPMVKFYNQSKYSDNYRWYFGDNSSGTFDNPYHRYMDTGIYKVILVAATDGVCSDSVIKYVHVQSFAEPQIPNTFSPNNDGINDEFYIRIENEILYELTIFDRQSNLVFSSRNKNEKWNGNTKDNKQCQAGSYFFFLNYQISGQDLPLVKTGSITLFR